MLSKAYKSLFTYSQNMDSYFTRSSRSITEKNIKAFKVISLGGMALLLLFILVTPYLIEGWQPTREYWGMIPTFAVFTLFIFGYTRFQWSNYYIIQIACVIMCVLLLFHLMLISIYPYPNDPQSFLTVMFIILPVVIIIKPFVMDLILLSAMIAYYLLAQGVKDPTVLSHDMFACVMSFTFAQVVMGVVYTIRLDDFHSGEQHKLQSRTDYTTGVLNRNSFENSCQKKLRDTDGGAPSAFFIFKICGLREISEEKGHMTGDKTLQLVGGCLKSAFRSADIVGRVGNDELCAFIDFSGDEAVARSKAEKILEDIDGFSERELGFNVGVCVGAAVIESRSNVYSDIYTMANEGLKETSLENGPRIAVVSVSEDKG